MKYQFKLVKMVSLSLVLFTFVMAALLFQKHSVEIIEWIDKLGWLAPLLFLIIYCMATILFLPTMVMTLAGGVLFGPLFGIILNLIGATLGAAFSFLITRYLAADWFARKKGAKLSKLVHEAEQRGWVLVALLRLFPLIPFNIVNYGLGITSIKFRTYLISTFIFLIPSEIVYTYFGYAGMTALLKQGNFYTNEGLIITGTIIVFLYLCRLGVLNFKKYFVKKNHTPD